MISLLLTIPLPSEAPQTTDILYAGPQLINPGETAPTHLALRFVVEGEPGFTAVEGKKIPTERRGVP